jgi:hypothetical protein
MNKRDHASKPHPRTSPDTDHRRVVVQHGNEASLGTKPLDRRKTILSRDNGQDFDGGAGPAAGAAPGSGGPATTY